MFNNDTIPANTDENLDPNLQLQNQRQLAVPASGTGGGTGATIPTPPPLPTAPAAVDAKPGPSDAMKAAVPGIAPSGTGNDATTPSTPPTQGIPMPPPLPSSDIESNGSAMVNDQAPTNALPTNVSPIGAPAIDASKIPAGSGQTMPNIPGYSGGFTAMYGDLAKYGNNATFQDLINSGTMTREQALKTMNPNFDPNDPTLNQAGVDAMLRTNVGAYSPNDPAGLNAAINALPKTGAQPTPTGPARYLQNGLETDAQGNAVAGGYNALNDIYRQLGTTPGTVNPQVIALVKQNPALIKTLPPDQAQMLTSTLSSMGVKLPAAATDATGGGALSGAFPTLGSAVPIGGAGAAGAGVAGANGQPFTPGNVAIGSTVLPNADPRLAKLQSLLDSSASSLAGVDRNKLAQDQFSTFAKSTDPQYQAAIRSATQAAAGAGRIGSGQLRTSYGDLALNRTNQLQNAQDTYMQNALEGSIGDQFNKTSALSGLESSAYGQGADTNNQLRTERGYQGSLEEQAFNRALEKYQLDQVSKQQQFNNGVTLNSIGTATNPAAYYAQLAAQLGMDPNTLMTLANSLGQKAAA